MVAADNGSWGWRLFVLNKRSIRYPGNGRGFTPMRHFYVAVTWPGDDYRVSVNVPFMAVFLMMVMCLLIAVVS